MKHNALAVILTLLVGAALAAVLWWDHQRSMPTTERIAPQPEGLRGNPVIRPPSPSPAPQVESANGLYRCDGNTGTSYQAAPCAPGARQAQLGGGTFSVVRPPPAPPILARPTVEESGGKVGFVARTPREGEGNEALCEQLEHAIRDVDAAARRGNSAQRQEWLKEVRRKYKDEMWRLKCGM